MIRKPQDTFMKKRWVYKLADLNLDPFKFPDETAKEYGNSSTEGTGTKVGNLVAPNIIVSEEMPGGESRKYSLFDNYVQVYRICENIRQKGSIPHLYEMCPYFMKIHFDLDVKMDFFDEMDIEESELKSLFQVSGDERKYFYILRPYMKAIETVFERLFPLNYDKETFVDNFLVFEAHRSDKISFHVILDGFYLPCHECWLFYKEVVDQLVIEGNVLQSQMADFSVYKKNQSFRLFGSNKSTMKNPKEGIKRIYNGPELDIGDGRVFSRERMVRTCFKDEQTDENLINLRILERSLLSHMIGNVRLTLNQSKGSASNIAKTMEKAGGKQVDIIEMKDDEIMKIMDVFYKHPVSKTESGERAFGFLKYVQRGGLICLKRTKENFCRVCEKKHEGENAFLFCNPTGDVSFVCRRAQESKKGGSCLYIGHFN